MSCSGYCRLNGIARFFANHQYNELCTATPSLKQIARSTNERVNSVVFNSYNLYFNDICVDVIYNIFYLANCQLLNLFQHPIHFGQG